ncbi:MAG: hypothetical protein AAGE52_38050 [Myxococcota bacterium]
MRNALVMISFVLACGGSDPSMGEPVALFSLPRGGEPFFDLPWPNDLRRNGEFIDVREFRNPRSVPLLEEYSAAMSERLTGYSVSAPGYLRFGVSIDESTIPATESATMEPDASVFIMQISGAGAGARHPAVVHYWDPETVYWAGHTLAVRPVHGLPLLAETTYAIVVTTDVKTADGRDLRRSDDFEAVADPAASSDGMIDAARTIYEPAFTVLANAGVARERVLNMAVFTTQDPVSELLAARDWLSRQPIPEPVADRWRWVRDDDEEGYTLVHGAYPSPTFQSGEIPYLDGGGEFTVDTTGAPVVHGSFDARFSITVPFGEMPENGWPIVLYAHGTGGNFESSLTVASTLANLGIATMGVDQIHHGERNPTTDGPEALSFNFINPFAFRDNARQSALDVVQQARFIANNPISDRVIASDPPVRFDPEQLYFMGHSQGGLNGPIYLAIDDSAKAAVLSGAGGHLAIALVEKTEPLNIPDLVRLILRLSGPEGESEHLVFEHPVFALLQTWTDVADPTNYMHLIFDQPREGFAPKSVLQTEGLTDAFTPPAAIEALALAGRIPLLEPELQPISSMSLVGINTQSVPAVGNIASGQATAGLLQFNGGHFVAFDNDALTTIGGFFASAVSDGVPSIR